MDLLIRPFHTIMKSIMSEDKLKDPKNTPKTPSSPNPLPILNDDIEEMESEMEAFFNEDQVKHQQGSAEPERD